MIGGWKNRRRIKINNFRSLSMPEYIDIRPITLLFGKNAAGKSSLIKAIKFLGHNLFPIQSGPTSFSLDKNNNLGDFEQIIAYRDINKDINIDFEEYWESFSENSERRESNIIHYELKTRFAYDQNEKNFKSLNIEDLVNRLRFNVFPDQKNNYDKEEINGFFNKPVTPAKRAQSFNKLKDSQYGHAGYPNKNIEIGRSSYYNNSKLDKFIKYLDVLPFFNFNSDLQFSYYNQLSEYLDLNEEQYSAVSFLIQRFILDIPTLSKKFFNHWYVTPVRERPRNKYRLIGNRFDPKEYYGILNQVDLRNETYNKYYPGNETQSDVLTFINATLFSFGLAKEFFINKEKGFGSAHIVDLFDVEHNLAESSSGLIQLLPIIVASFNALYEYSDYVSMFDADYSTDVIIIEQPELHLHPALQTKLIEFISKSSGGTYIIETHSEHVVRKLQVLIAQGYRKENIAVYYFDKDNNIGVTSVKEMKFDDNGLFVDKWPEGFFDEKMKLTLELLDSIKRRSN